MVSLVACDRKVLSQVVGSINCDAAESLEHCDTDCWQDQEEEHHSRTYEATLEHAKVPPDETVDKPEDG